MYQNMRNNINIRENENKRVKQTENYKQYEVMSTYSLVLKASQNNKTDNIFKQHYHQSHV